MTEAASELRVVTALSDLDVAAWDALVPDSNPFLRHAFLAGLERDGCIRAAWGWRAHHLALYRGHRLVAAAPAYLKDNSHGEFVFDWHWARAWQDAGGDYYPKLLCAVPYSPVSGPRLLAGSGPDGPELRRQLVAALVVETTRLGLATAHANFIKDDELDAFDDAWLPRFDWQFHWHNRGYRDFADFLAVLKHHKRANVRHERVLATDAVDCSIERGDSLSPADWRKIHALYRHTFDSKGNTPTLTLAFFRHLAASLGAGLQVALARRGDAIVAMALFLASHDTLYGRYWGSFEPIPALHFELCYYQGIDYAIRAGLAHFEPGAQGEHKIPRGFLPAITHSRHYLANAAFRTAVARSLAREAEGLEAYRRELLTHSPYAEAAP